MRRKLSKRGFKQPKVLEKISNLTSNVRNTNQNSKVPFSSIKSFFQNNAQSVRVQKKMSS